MSPRTDAERLRHIAGELDIWRDIEGSGYSSLVAMGVSLRAIADRLEKRDALERAVGDEIEWMRREDFAEYDPTELFDAIGACRRRLEAALNRAMKEAER